MSSRIRLSIFIAAAALLLASCAGPKPEAAIIRQPERSLIRFVASEYSTETKPLLQKLVKEFELKNPLIDVELQVANWDILDGIYTTMISKNQPPDLLNTNVYAHFAKDGLLNDFNEILSPELKRKLQPNLMYMDRIDGVQHAIPYVATVRNMYYNEDLFEQAQIEAPPATWSELREAARKIKSATGAYGFGVDLTDNETQAYLSYVFFGSGGGWLRNGEWAINSPENVEGLSFLKEMFDQGLTDPEPTVTTRDEKQRIMGDGNLGLMISGNYFMTVVPREYPGFRWGAGPIPVKDGKTPITFGVHDVLVSFKTDHTDRAALSKFLDFLYDNSAYEEMVNREGFLPVTLPVGSKLSETDPVMKTNLAALVNARFYPVQKPAWQAVVDRARKLGNAVLYDHLSPKDALDQLQRFAVERSGR